MGRFDALTQLDKKSGQVAPPQALSSPPINTQEPPSLITPSKRTSQPAPQKPVEKADTMKPRYRDTTILQHHDTMIPSDRDTMIPSEETEEQMYEAVRKAVRQVGKEPATQRLTLEEKQALMDIEYTYRRQGIKTSGNEIIRIATNYIVREYYQHGGVSILANILKKLNT